MDSRRRRKLCEELRHETEPMFVEKDHRNEDRNRPTRGTNRLLLVGILVCSLLAVIVLAGIGYILWTHFKHTQDEAEPNRLDQDYLRKLVKQVNENRNSTWKAKFNKFGVKNRSYGFVYTRNATAVREYLDEVEKFFNGDIMKQHIQELEDIPDSSLPTHFDSRLKWPHCPSISNVPNQGGCGSCFAVAAVGVASDRACIQSNGTFRALLSEEDVLGCCSVCGNCYGGDPLKALTYFVNEGLVTGGRDGCRPYSFDYQCGVPCSPATFFAAEGKRTCIRRCQNIYYQNKYDDDKKFATIAYSMYPRSMTISADGKEKAQVPTIIGKLNETAPLSLDQIRTVLKKEISHYGPTTMAFPVTEEFLHYSSGVFRPFPEEGFSDRIVYWHVVRLIGWGQEEDGTHYWLAINSFGNHWGDGGTFKINVDSMEQYGLEYETALV